MDEIVKRYAQDEAFREVADMIFGEGHSLVHKANPDQSDLHVRGKREKRQAQVGLASNIVGIAAGVAGTAAASKNPALKRKNAVPKNAGPVSRRAMRYMKTPKGKARLIQAGAGAALGLQAVNVAGDAVANRVLSRESKKKPNMIHKSIKEIPEGSVKCGAGKLTRATTMKPSDKVVAGRGKKTGKFPEKVVNKSAEIDVKWEGEISKVDSDKRQVFGWASIVEIGGEPVVDLQGDYIAIDEVEKSAYEYVHKSRKGGDMHLRDEFGEPKVGSHMIESFVVTEDKKKALGLPDSAPTGWWVGYQVNDDDLWQKVKSGERTGFSIHGRGVRSSG